MKSIIWLASYPKSGNTWFRVFLSNYLSRSSKPVNINKLTGGPIASARGVFDREMGVAASLMTGAEIRRYRPLVYEAVSEQGGPQFLKVHDAHLVNDEGPMFPHSATKGVLYFIRNPLDVAISYANHNNSTIDQAIERMGNAKHVLSPFRTLNRQLPQPLFTWSGHVLSWIESGHDVHFMRYEDTLEDPVSAFSRAVEFCGLPLNSKRVAKAVEFSRFDRLKKQEQTKSFRETPRRAQSFFRKGRANDWMETLSPRQIDKICQDHEEVMTRFAYLPLPTIPKEKAVNYATQS